jgi:hypothetical protein
MIAVRRGMKGTMESVSVRGATIVERKQRGIGIAKKMEGIKWLRIRLM